MNAKTPGPLVIEGGCLIGADTRTHVAGVHGPNLITRTTERLANRRLLATGFNAFDRAGRELGIDAATLAESLDLAALIRAAQTLLGTMPLTGGWHESEREALRATLAKLPEVTP